jgi:threonine dehydratase
MRLHLQATHNMPEPAGALALAALLAEGDRVRGKRVAIIQTGGNVDAATLATVLEGRTPLPPSRRSDALPAEHDATVRREDLPRHPAAVGPQ